MAEIEQLTELADWSLLWDAQKAKDAGALLVLKFSPICPTSHAAEDEARRFVAALADSIDLKIVSVDVIGQRSISQRIAADTRLRHESPQALLISRGQNISWHESHGGITAASLAEAFVAAKV